MANELSIDKAVVELAWPKHKWDAQLTPDAINDIQQKATFLVDQKIIRANVDVAQQLVRPWKGLEAGGQIPSPQPLPLPLPRSGSAQ